MKNKKYSHKIFKISRERYNRVIAAITMSDAEWTFGQFGTSAEWRRLRRSAAAKAIEAGNVEVTE